ncbi:MAG: hypothetical protein HY443_00335 [Candidatus Nealsonbacteria bacterium]|nr:hypothetical protein [Candidatus Nealsonbacteria bacterium]
MVKTYTLVTGVIFLTVALLHLSRIVSNWQVVLGDWTLPVWVSWLGLIVAGFLAFQGLKLSRK